MDALGPVMLGASAMIYRVCTWESCKRVGPVNQAVSFLNEYLGENCSYDNEDKAVAVLKAFGNMGYHGEAQSNIIACMQDASKPTRIRLAAIDSFRRIKAKRPDEFVQKFKDRDEDSEVRIAIVSSIFKNADEKQIEEIKETAENESNDQVGAYISSYVKNMKKTKTPIKQKAKKLFQKVDIQPPKYNYWQNSKNIEVSTFSKSWNVGGGVEADIIHSSDSKLPRTISSLVHADIFGHNFNLLELGARAEGLEKIIHRILGLKDSIPQEQSQETSKYLIGDSDSELSFFIRMLDVEMFDLSAADLLGIGEMIKIAEVMNKLTEGRNADFSQSFTFLNSKIVIPSVTGRSYSIDLQGSATAALTASTKADLLTLPYHADMHLHLQPSANIEISATVGIQSSKQRPDVKFLHRTHFKSNLEAKFNLRDRHAKASLILPSENVFLVQFSTDVIEIDENHNEKRMYDKMQKKINHCFKNLHRPLGISTCTFVEVPKPFVTRAFPHILPFGTIQLAMKKSDKSFRSYEIEIEIPNHSGPEMNYKASFDTPGSKIPRRFAAEVGIKQHEDHKQFSVELTTPMTNAGLSGSFTNNDKLKQATVKLHSGSEQILSANVTTEISRTRSRNSYETSSFASFRGYEPVTVNGTVTIIRGRKDQLIFDFKTNKDGALKGTIMKEGHLEFSPKSEWKLSTEASLSCPVIDIQLRKTIDKKPTQLAVNFGVDYQKSGGKEYSVTFSGTSQKSSGKMSTSAKFEMSQYPGVNWYWNWVMQKESRESIKNYMILKYGRNLKENYILFKQLSRLPQPGHGENSVSLEISQLGIDYELSVKHILEMDATPKFYVDVDLRYDKNKHIEGRIGANYESKTPLKASGLLEVKYLGVHYIFKDEVAQTSENVIEGKSSFQYKENKKIQLKYNYKRLSDDSKFHHEIESSLQTPSSASPINCKASVKVSNEYLAFVGEIGAKYSVQAHLKRKGLSHVNLKLPSLEGKFKANNEVWNKNVSLDLILKTKNPRHATALVSLQKSDVGHKYHLEIVPDVNKTELKILAHSEFELLKKPSGDTYKSFNNFQVVELVNVSLSKVGDVGNRGNHEFTFVYLAEGLNPIIIHFEKKIRKETTKSSMIISIGGIDVLKMQLDSNWRGKANNRKLSVKGSIKSPRPFFHDLSVKLSQQVIKSGSVTTIESRLYLSNNGKVYKAELNSGMQPNGIELNAEMQTPHENYEKQALGISLQRSDNGISSLLRYEFPYGKILSVETHMKKKSQEFALFSKVTSPLEGAKDVLVQIAAVNGQSEKSLKASIDVGKAKITDLQYSMRSSPQETKVEGSFNVSVPGVRFHKLNMKYRRTKSSILASGNLRLEKSKEFSFASEVKKESDVISLIVTVSTPYEKLKDGKMYVSIEFKPPYKRSFLFYVDLNGERKGDVELSTTSSSNVMELKSRIKTPNTSEISAHWKYEKTGKSFSILANVVKGAHPLFSTSLNRLSYTGGEKLAMKTKNLEKTILDVEVSNEEQKDKSKKFTFKASGEFPEVSVVFSKKNNDPTSISTELHVCQKIRQTKCYSLKYHKSAKDYKLNQKHRLELEKSVDGSSNETLGSLLIDVKQDEHDSGSKVILRMKDREVGYKMELHKRLHANDHHSFDFHIFLLQRTSRLRAAILHNNQHARMELDAIPNTEDLTYKYAFDMKNEINPQTKDIAGYIKVELPSRSEPFLFTCKVEPVDETFVKGKLQLHYSTTPGKTLIFEVDPSLDQESHEIQSLAYKLYTEDKSLDTHLKLIKQHSKQEDKVGYEWKYSSEGDEKLGGAIATFYDKKAGKPKSLKISYFSPSAEYEVEGSIARAPEHASVSLASRGQKLKEIHIKTSDECLNIQITESDSLMSSSFCLNKREGDTLYLVKAEVLCEQQKCVDVSLYLDPLQPDFVSLDLEWKKQDIILVLRKVSDYDEIFKGKSLTKVVQELLDNLAQTRRDVLSYLQQNIRKKLNIIREEISRKAKYVSNWHSEVVDEHIQSARRSMRSIISYFYSLIPIDYFVEQVFKPFKEAGACFFREYYRIVVRHIPRIMNLVMQVTRSQLDHCLRKFCVPGTFCHTFFQSYEEHGLQAAQVLIRKEIAQVKENIKIKIPSINFADLIRWIHSEIAKFRKEIETVFGKILGDTILSRIGDYFKKLEQVFRQKAIDAIDKIIDNINNIFRGDEDYEMAKSLAAEAKTELENTWRNKEKIVKRSYLAVKNKIKENAKATIHEYFRVQKFGPKGGQIKLSFRQPLGAPEIAILKNELRTINRKIEDYFRN